MYFIENTCELLWWLSSVLLRFLYRYFYYFIKLFFLPHTKCIWIRWPRFILILLVWLINMFYYINYFGKKMEGSTWICGYLFPIKMDLWIWWPGPLTAPIDFRYWISFCFIWETKEMSLYRNVTIIVNAKLRCQNNAEGKIRFNKNLSFWQSQKRTNDSS